MPPNANMSDRMQMAPHRSTLTGELYDLLTLPLDEPDYAIALATLGMEVDPPGQYAPGGWLVELAGRLHRR